MNALAVAAHVLSAVVWVGGMFFAYIVLRPTLATLEGPVRLQIWSGALKRFFPWVWLTILVLLLSGYFLVFNVFGGHASAPPYVHLMISIGWLMFLLFGFLFHRPYRQFKDAIQSEQWSAAATAMNRIRQIVLVNLILGICVVAVASGGRYFSIL